MSTRLTVRLGVAALALAFIASPAFAQTQTQPETQPQTDTTPTTPMPMHHHHTMHHGNRQTAGEGKLMPTEAGDAAIADLNAQSLAAAQSGQTFTPSGTPSSAPATAAPT